MFQLYFCVITIKYLLFYRLGNETHKTKQVSKSKPLWCEWFNIYMYEENNLEITVWQKGKQKIFMGR